MGHSTESLVAIGVNRVACNMFIATCTLAVYDILLTIEDDVEYIWKSSWTSTKFLFMWIRYTPLFKLATTIWQLTAKSDLSVGECTFIFDSATLFIYVELLATEVILLIRTWAIYERRRKIGFALAIWTAAIWIPMAVFLWIFNVSLRFGPLYPHHIAGAACHPVSANPIFFAYWLLFIIFELGKRYCNGHRANVTFFTVSLALMIGKAVQIYRFTKYSAMFKAIFRNGTSIYIYLFILSIANLVIILATPPTEPMYFLLLSALQCVIHSALTSRMMLNLRKLNREGSLGLATFSVATHSDERHSLGEMRFARTPQMHARPSAEEY
ncbi:hypothetical protein PHLGIDRAFT_432353 [Phlebiopsis gigantea 11061_1 CR5-6]|uniref:DUF6533 domain-containing protein n=1 Tax=Phlebiopsis gigantea (strain 11061_1 CR5-6) TaxID=745531 RepID=A0A0C3NPL9_PHLG1|nr:hypothetical protein PHLGIDRAFT_432353 [Phlebiopsis gigantea 11061_1 CR5-6]